MDTCTSRPAITPKRAIAPQWTKDSKQFAGSVPTRPVQDAADAPRKSVRFVGGKAIDSSGANRISRWRYAREIRSFLAASVLLPLDSRIALFARLALYCCNNPSNPSESDEAGTTPSSSVICRRKSGSSFRVMQSPSANMVAL